jgi:hypothetical protein
MSPDRTAQEYLVRIHDYRKGLLREDDLAVACIRHRCCTHSSRLEACTFCYYSRFWLEHCVSCDTSHTKEIAKHLQEISRVQVSDRLRWAPTQGSHLAWAWCCARLGMWNMPRRCLRHLAGIERANTIDQRG